MWYGNVKQRFQTPALLKGKRPWHVVCLLVALNAFPPNVLADSETDDLETLQALYDESSEARWAFKKRIEEKRSALKQLRNTCSRWTALLYLLNNHLHYQNAHGGALKEKYNLDCTLIAVIDNLLRTIQTEERQLQRMRKTYMRLRQQVFSLSYKLCARKQEENN